jgi:ketosteroid isomerase-like protein
MEDALNRRDLDALLANVDDNVAFTAMNAESGYGKQHIRDYFNRMLNGPDKVVENIKVDFVPDALAVFQGPDVAVSAGNADSHYELTNGMKFDITARWTGTLVRKDGRWLVGAFHYSANVFRNPILDTQRKYLLGAGGAAALVLGIIGFFVGRLSGRRKG